jgi:hypothetical protein
VAGVAIQAFALVVFARSGFMRRGNPVSLLFYLCFTVIQLVFCFYLRPYIIRDSVVCDYSLLCFQGSIANFYVRNMNY